MTSVTTAESTIALRGVCPVVPRRASPAGSARSRPMANSSRATAAWATRAENTGPTARTTVTTEPNHVPIEALSIV